MAITKTVSHKLSLQSWAVDPASNTLKLEWSIVSSYLKTGEQLTLQTQLSRTKREVQVRRLVWLAPTKIHLPQMVIIFKPHPSRKLIHIKTQLGLPRSRWKFLMAVVLLMVMASPGLHKVYKLSFPTHLQLAQTITDLWLTQCLTAWRRFKMPTRVSIDTCNAQRPKVPRANRKEHSYRRTPSSNKIMKPQVSLT